MQRGNRRACLVCGEADEDHDGGEGEEPQDELHRHGSRTGRVILCFVSSGAVDPRKLAPPPPPLLLGGAPKGKGPRPARLLRDPRGHNGRGGRRKRERRRRGGAQGRAGVRLKGVSGDLGVRDRA